MSISPLFCVFCISRYSQSQLSRFYCTLNIAMSLSKTFKSETCLHNHNTKQGFANLTEGLSRTEVEMHKYTTNMIFSKYILTKAIDDLEQSRWVCLDDLLTSFGTLKAGTGFALNSLAFFSACRSWKQITLCWLS